MNLVGKILVVFIFVMSIVFMSFAMAVYATHRNWRNEVLGSEQQPGLKQRLQTEQNRVQELEASRQRLETALANEKTARERALAALETERDNVANETARLNTEINRLNAEHAKAVNAATLTQETMKKLREQMAVLQEQLDTARLERDERFKEAVKLTDELAQATGELSRLDQMNKKLAQDNSALSLALQDANIQLDRKGPPRVEGVVLASRANGLVEISLGFDDGLEKGHALEVYRQGPSEADNKYLGKIEVVETQADRAVARVLPNFRKGTIQKEDRVATRLQ
jgi:hypothetical protein